MIIGISGKIGSGKDTVANIINGLTDSSITDREVVELAKGYILNPYPKWEIKKFADKLKDIVCLLIGCTREQLEDREFKEKELGEEWIRYGYADGFTTDNNGNKTMIFKECDKERYEIELRVNWQTAYKIHYTPRTLLQAIGTNLFRNQLLDNIWVNALMSNYKGITATIIDKDCPRQGIYEVTEDDELQYGKIDKLYPNWIVTDVRFPNEAEAIKDKGGILIRINRDLQCEICKQTKAERRGSLCNEITCPNGRPKHESETALDDYQDFDYIIYNFGTIEDLIEKVRKILIKEKLI